MRHIYTDISPWNDVLRLPEDKAAVYRKLSDIYGSCIVPVTAESLFQMKTGSVYFDMSGTAVPQRNHIYPLLRSKGIQIVSLISEAMTSAVNFPWTVKEEQLMVCMDHLSAAMKHSSGAVYENECAEKAFAELCRRAGSDCPEKVMPDNIMSLSRENGTVNTSTIKQMAVLTARNDDIMKSLPFIERFMPFIEELVVCCPERNVKPFREKYTGRLSLTFTTDDELLCGRSLPSDHQARNFFLRCLLMEQDALDDVFIMTDDDYRPIKPITEEVFIKDGRYQAYYFYDLRKWQGTYNDYTSFDKGAFKTRDFLIKHGYDTLQYSSHQPQVIDKRVFREMLTLHKGIENNPYDEWSTYFNFGVYHHPDKFMPQRNVSMCWPADTASWELCHEPDEFLFENFYEDLYDKNGIFEGLSTELCVKTESENMQKADICRRLVKKQLSEQRIFGDYCREYSAAKGFHPEIIIDCGGVLSISSPEYIRLPSNCWTRVPVRISAGIYGKYKDRQLYLSYHFLNNMGVPVLNSPEIPVSSGDTRLMLPVRSPQHNGNICSLIIKAIIKADAKNTAEAQAETESDLILIQEK